MDVKERMSGKQFKAFSPRKPKRVEMTSDECKKLCTAVGLEYLEGYEGRVIEHVITDETVDRYGDIVRAKGAIMANFKKNPTIQFAHDYKSPPVGKALKVWYDSAENNIKAQGVYFDGRVDSTGKAGVVFNFIASGAMPACSIGFVPLEVSRPKNEEERRKLGLGDNGLEFKKWELLEYSPCPVPANPNALQNALKDLSVDDRQAVKENEEAFKHILPEGWVESIVETLETESVPDVVINNATITVEPTNDGTEEMREFAIKQAEVMERFITEFQSLGVKIDALKDAIVEASVGKSNVQVPPKAVEPSGKIYDEAASMIRSEFQFNL